MIRAIIENVLKEPAGIWKLEEMELACGNGNEFWPVFIDIIIPVRHNGLSFMSALSSSSLGFVMMQALFRNLLRNKSKTAHQTSIVKNAVEAMRQRQW